MAACLVALVTELAANVRDWRNRDAYLLVAVTSDFKPASARLHFKRIYTLKRRPLAEWLRIGLRCAILFRHAPFWGWWR